MMITALLEREPCADMCEIRQDLHIEKHKRRDPSFVEPIEVRPRTMYVPTPPSL
jgi:hypothetical protein